jgi:SMI1/KNR4 family protein SUKH-1
MAAFLVPAPRVTIEAALQVLEKDLARHMTTDRPSELELDALEEALGGKLPEQFRTLLSRVGGGIFYERHELFGARRLMVHDIELVPDLLSFHRRFAADNQTAPTAALVPFHRADGVVHLLDLRSGAEAVVSADGGRSYPDLASFLLRVVIPSVSPAAT